MRKLETALKDGGFTVGASGLRALVLETYRDDFPGWSSEDLLHNPTRSGRFVRLVRERMDGQKVPAVTILRTLTNLRKAKQLPQRGRGSIPKLDDQLEEGGYGIDAQSLRSIIADEFREQNPDRSCEDLLHDPGRAERFARSVRQRSGVRNLPSAIILATLTYLRKASLLPPRDHA